MQKKSPTSASGQYYGYSIQPTRQCFHLLCAPKGSVVALEALDDVDIAHPDGSKIVEQDKSGLATNPVSDWSVDLWKTFANWIDAIEAGHLDLSLTYFRLYVVQKKKGGIIDRLRYAHTEELALAVVAEIKEQYESVMPSGCKAYIEKFLSYSPEKLAKLIVRFEYDAGEGNPTTEIEDILRNTISDVFLKDACAAAIGWVKTRSDQLISEGRPSGIAKDEFSDWLSTFCSKLSYDYLLVCSVPAPEKVEVERNIDNYPVMMRQIDIIELGYQDKLKAMMDFMRAKANKVSWAEKGLIVESQYKDFESYLIDYWSLHRLKLKSMSALNEVEKGQALYLECGLFVGKLNGKDVPSYFSRGTYQYLSNEKMVGWHPNYSVLF